MEKQHLVTQEWAGAGSGKTERGCVGFTESLLWFRLKLCKTK